MAETSLLRPRGIPSWWMDKGIHMRSKDRGLPLTVWLHSSAAEVFVRHCQEDDAYEVKWLLTHSTGRVQGTVFMGSDDLEKAFGLSDGFGAGGEAVVALTKQYADAAAQGRYFRCGEYLNIPGPGTRLQGDPNISIFISDEIRAAVRELIKRTVSPAP